MSHHERSEHKRTGSVAELNRVDHAVCHYPDCRFEEVGQPGRVHNAARHHAFVRDDHRVEVGVIDS